ncbi:MAG: cytochrome c [Deltaproteobacteria bacterium]|nr:cytochrome c [Deltaproteobacteria bacterium]
MKGHAKKAAQEAAGGTGLLGTDSSPSTAQTRSPRSRVTGHLLIVVLGAVLAVTTLEGCMRGCGSSRPPIHPNYSMFNQPKYRPYGASAFFYDGAAMRRPVPGTVARGHLVEDPVLESGKSADGSPVASSPVAVDEALVDRGRDRYGIYCQPCHDERGEGKGILFQRAKVPTANLLDKRIRDLPDGSLFDTITNGKGLMAGYRYPIRARDRWAIIAYVRSLEKAQAQREAAR